MNFHLPMLKRVACGVAAAGMLSSCTLSSTETPQPSNQPIFAAPPATPVHVSGYAWDPEAFLTWFLTCSVPPGSPPGTPDNCPEAPVLVPGSPTFDEVTVQGAMVQLFDPANPGPPPYALSAAQPTAADGLWTIGGVPSRPGPPFLPFALPPSDASTAIGHGIPTVPNGPMLPIAPASQYFATITLQPIDTSYTDCRGLGAAVIGDTGFLQTVAKYISATGGPATTAADLTNPAKFGGVVVVALTAPTGAPTNIPGFGMPITADKGTLYYIDFAPPAGSPPCLSSPYAPSCLPTGGGPGDWQSDRGFFVNHDSATSTDPHASFGVAVLTLPPGPPGPPVPTDVQFSFVDDATGPDPSGKLPPHPWVYPPLPPLTIVGGEVSFLTVPGLQPGGPPPPPFLCIPQGP